MQQKAAYIPRLIDSEIERSLSLFGAVEIVGPKWCGKTTSAVRAAKSVLYMTDGNRANDYLEISRNKPSLLLKGDKPRLIDEWQVAPEMWDTIRHNIDMTSLPGQYILTSSANIDPRKKKHTGTGRIITIGMHTLSLAESGDSDGSVSLGGLFGSQCDVSGRSGLDYLSISEVLVRGGWPFSVGKKGKDAHSIVAGYCEAVLNLDIDIPEDRKRDPQRMGYILRSLARNTATSAPNSTIIEDLGGENFGISPNTLTDYINALKGIHVVEDLPAWLPKLRSRTAIRSKDVRHMTDPAIAAYFLGAGATDLQEDPGTFGLLFESLAVRDLRVYTQHLGGNVYHYRDSNGLECDAVVYLHDGKWGAVEVKLGGSHIDQGAKNLLKLRDRVDEATMNPPSFLAVVTGTEYAYTREDGVHVIPLGCLGPRYSIRAVRLWSICGSTVPEQIIVGADTYGGAWTV